MMKYFVAYLIVAVVFLVIDYFWLSYVMKDFFYDRVGHLMAEEVKMGVAAVFYLFFAIGIVLFCVAPALTAGSWVMALGYGVIFGVMAYGAYDITNLATIKDWPMSIAVLDITWGGFITGVSSLVGYLAISKIYGS